MVAHAETLAGIKPTARRSERSYLEGMSGFVERAGVAPHAQDKGNQTIEREAAWSGHVRG